MNPDIKSVRRSPGHNRAYRRLPTRAWWRTDRATHVRRSKCHRAGTSGWSTDDGQVRSVLGSVVTPRPHSRVHVAFRSAALSAVRNKAQNIKKKYFVLRSAGEGWLMHDDDGAGTSGAHDPCHGLVKDCSSSAAASGAGLSASRLHQSSSWMPSGSSSRDDHRMPNVAYG